MLFKLMMVNKKRVCKNSFYNGKYYNSNLDIICYNCNNIAHLKNYTIDIKIESENMYKWLHKVYVRDDDNFNLFIMDKLNNLKKYLEKNKKYITAKNRKYSNIYFLVNAHKYNQKIKTFNKYGTLVLSVKRGYNAI